MNDSRLKHGLFSLIDKRERWGLTFWGWIVLVLAAPVAGLVCVSNIHGFLAIECPVRGQLLVIEGWIPDYSIPGAISEFENHDYRSLIAVGSPILSGSHLSQFKSYAELTQARLEELGFKKDQMVVIATQDIKRDRTFEAAMMVKRWISGSGAHVKAIDVYTLGAHARRSRLLFKKAFGDDVAVGVIAADDQSYDPKSWWKSSNGARTVVDELIAYLYAIVFFHS